MIRASALACLAALLFCGAATAQRNVYGTLSCAATSAPDPHGKAGPKQTPDPPGKAAPKQGVSQQTCSWPEPVILAEIAARDAQGTFHSEISGNRSQDTADFQIHMNNGDQVTLQFAGTSVLNDDGSTRSREGTWTLTKGTGMFNGITGDGHYAGIRKAAGGVAYDLEGAYQLPSDLAKSSTPPATPPQQLAPSPQQAPPQQQTPPPQPSPQNKSKDEG